MICPWHENEHASDELITESNDKLIELLKSLPTFCDRISVLTSMQANVLQGVGLSGSAAIELVAAALANIYGTPVLFARPVPRPLDKNKVN